MNSDNQPLQENSAAGAAAVPARPAFHFTPPNGWMNDPNGLVFYDGEFHLFYQHNPNGPDFGPMHWGHAITRDFLNWTNLPTALHPDEYGEIYSGSVVVDWMNSSGFGTADDPPLIAVYTYHHMDREKDGEGDHQTQALAYSLDRGRNWTKYSGNPVLGNEKKQPDFRDPKIFWHEPDGQWIKSLAAGDHVEFFASPDLKNWSFLSSFGEGLYIAGKVWECPDLFPLEAPDGGKKWVLIVSVNPGGPQGGSGTQYFIGDFDGSKFSLDPDFADFLSDCGTAWLDWGSDNYAGVTWSDIPQTDGRRLFIGWMSNWQYARHAPSSVWRGAMTVPRELTLRKAGTAILLAATPAREIVQKMEQTQLFHPNEGEAITPLTAPFEPGEVKIAARLQSNSDVVIGLELRNPDGEWTRIGFNAAVNEFFCEHYSLRETDLSKMKSSDRSKMPRFLTHHDLEIRFLIDRNSIELFADGGLSVFTETFFPDENYDEIKFLVDNGPGEVESINISRFAPWV